jgi:NitT/TauT family transport system ATP-binding protein
LDEPTRLQLQDELVAIQSRFQMTILFVTHSFYEAVAISNRIIILSASKPTQIIFDQLQTRNFISRFETNYQNKVQEISAAFAHNGLKNA